MNKISLTILLTILLSLSVSAQKEKDQNLSDFSGTWILDEDSSFGNSVSKEDFEDFTLVISPNEPEIKIRQTYLFKGKPSEHTIKLFTDKRGEENVYFVERNSVDYNNSGLYWLEDINMKSKTYLKKGKIIREGGYKTNFSKYPVVIKETYVLSTDGKTMTIFTEPTVVTPQSSFGESSIPKPPASIVYKFIFRKKWNFVFNLTLENESLVNQNRNTRQTTFTKVELFIPAPVEILYIFDLTNVWNYRADIYIKIISASSAT